MSYRDDGVGPRVWLIYNRAHGLFWRAGGEGYTTDIAAAGLFSETFAMRMTGASYADRSERAEHLSAFSYVLAEQEHRLAELKARFALLQQQQDETCGVCERTISNADTISCPHCGTKWATPLPGKLQE